MKKIEKNNLTKLSRNQIYAMKAFAIMCVVPAHIPFVPDNYSIPSQTISVMLSTLGSMGVGVFFFVSGYLLDAGNTKNLDIKMYLMKKIKTLGLPWFVSGSLLYIYIAIRKTGNVIGYLKYMFGYMSSLWYMSVLFVFLFVFYYIERSKNCNIVCVICGLLSVVSAGARWMGLVPNTPLGLYLNPFNWVIFFSGGILFKRYEKMVIAFVVKSRYVFLAMFFAIVFSGVLGFRLSYYNVLYIPMELLVICTSLCFGLFFENSRLVRFLGLNSFCIYLYHELPWAGLVSRFALKVDFFVILFLIPIVVIVCTILMIKIGYVTSEKIGLESLYCRLTSYKDK